MIYEANVSILPSKNDEKTGNKILKIHRRFLEKIPI